MIVDGQNGSLVTVNNRLLCRHGAQGMIWGLVNWDWPRPKKIMLPTRADDHPCASENCCTCIHLGQVPWMTSNFAAKTDGFMVDSRCSVGFLTKGNIISSEIVVASKNSVCMVRLLGAQGFQ